MLTVAAVSTALAEVFNRSSIDFPFGTRGSAAPRSLGLLDDADTAAAADADEEEEGLALDEDATAAAAAGGDGFSFGFDAEAAAEDDAAAAAAGGDFFEVGVATPSTLAAYVFDPPLPSTGALRSSASSSRERAANAFEVRTRFTLSPDPILLDDSLSESLLCLLQL